MQAFGRGSSFPTPCLLMLLAQLVPGTAPSSSLSPSTTQGKSPAHSFQSQNSFLTTTTNFLNTRSSFGSMRHALPRHPVCNLPMLCCA
ncbi:hypothetical protein C8F04DRAFT_1062737 [Mycena alexandri]|uniref:Uncharacterized protein n=1 Tax=Mycena alexandri TaxID=1745969 RepID=A0AAD6TI99_9AGAR|nr:hypothetical protein C8F04DRAFT_1062737 [Mycena alexandri]